MIIYDPRARYPVECSICNDTVLICWKFVEIEGEPCICIRCLTNRLGLTQNARWHPNVYKRYPQMEDYRPEGGKGRTSPVDPGETE